ncbi:hypothetical protein V1506DRAFT_166411 [Lipomyces tetrasporus]
MSQKTHQISHQQESKAQTSHDTSDSNVDDAQEDAGNFEVAIKFLRSQVFDECLQLSLSHQSYSRLIDNWKAGGVDNRSRIIYDNNSSQVTIVRPSAIHDLTAMYMEDWILHSVLGFLSSYAETSHLTEKVRKTETRGKIVQDSKGHKVKKGDGGLEIKLGEYFRTCTIEVGISETLAQLRKDMMTWFNSGVNIVLLVNISEAERFRNPEEIRGNISVTLSMRDPTLEEFSQEQ